MAPSHRTGEVFRRASRSAGIPVEDTRLDQSHAHDGGTLQGEPRQKFPDVPSVIIPLFASKSLSLYRFGVPGLKRTLFCIGLLVFGSTALISCGGGYSTSGSGSGGGSGNAGSRPSGLASRAFVSNPLNPTGAAGSFNPVLNIVNALPGSTATDTLSLSTVSLNSGPGLMTLSPNGLLTLVFSPDNNSITVVDNNKEAIAQSGSTAVQALTLPGPTESMIAGHDNLTGFAAVPTAPVAGAPPVPGAVIAFGLFQGAIAATIPVPGARTLVSSHNGNRILTFADNSSTVTILTPSSINTSIDPRTAVCCFDHPVWGIFSADDTTAYIFDCGPECGGTTAGITVLNMLTSSVGATLALPGATYGMVNGSTMYVVGKPPGTLCPSGTAATTCGTLSLVDFASMTASPPVIITDGYHNRMDISANGQLFVGSKTCSNVTSPTETRGCLSIYNTTTPGVVIPPDNGDVTGVAAIPGRTVMYLCQGGNFLIYDTTTDKLLVPPSNQTQIDIVGKSVDVKFVN